MKKTKQPSATDIKVQENRVRRMAERQGYVVTKKRRIDRRARDYGTYTIEHVDSDLRRDMLTLDEIEFGFLLEDNSRKRAEFFKPPATRRKP